MVTGLVDTDILIDSLRQYPPAHAWLSKQIGLGVVSVSWIELLQGTTNKIGQRKAFELLRKFERIDPEPQDYDWAIQALSSFHLSHNLMGFDALIAATSHRLQVPLYTRNVKHFTPLLGSLVQKPY